MNALLFAELADELGCRKQSLFKVIDRLGLKTIKIRDPDRGNQLVSTITSVEAQMVKNDFITKRKTLNENPGIEAEQLVIDEGLFYIIQLEPEHDSGRIKVGFTTDLDGRLQKHRCSAPFAQYMKSWPCRRSWERAAIDCLTIGLEQLHTEVFRAVSIEEVILRGEGFFGFMPKVVNEFFSGEEET